ncbi:MAG: CPXCG motif-containing cysteine-rich protein [Elusimicrobiota bacterium]|jgi:hypothetical protein
MKKTKKTSCRKPKAKPSRTGAARAKSSSKSAAKSGALDAPEAAFNPEEFRVEEAAPRAEPRWIEVRCPYCDEPFDIRVDPSAEEGQSMVQDCQVCCKTIQISVDIEDGEISVFASRS